MELPIVSTNNLSKSFGATKALDQLSLSCQAGSVHAIMGENGAGKSTFIKILSGVYTADSGSVLFNNREVSFTSPLEAQAAGVATIFQEFTLLPNLSVAENLFLGVEKENGRRIPKNEMRTRATNLMAQLDSDLDPDMPVLSLSVGEQQLVEIAKGLRNDAELFIFDEPTAALAIHEVDQLFALIRKLKSRGKAIFYISHRLSEIFDICDTITVFKDGRFVDTVNVDETTPDSLIEKMVGRPLAKLYPARGGATNRALLTVEGLAGQNAPHPVSFDICEGEIIGIAGLEGQGQAELMRLLMGFDKTLAGSLKIRDLALHNSTAQERIRGGLGFVPENRKDDGLFPSLDIFTNLLTARSTTRSLFSWLKRDRALANAAINDLQIKAQSGAQNVMELSGGNQQKVLLGRWLVAGVDVILCEEPTRGVDVGAKAEIYIKLREFAENGKAVLITSRELPEILGLCDRIFVIRDQQLVTELSWQEASEERIMRSALPGNIEKAA